MIVTILEEENNRILQQADLGVQKPIRKLLPDSGFMKW